MSADLGKRLAELRKYNQMTKEELGQKLSVKAKDITKWESGEDSPDGEQLIKLSHIYQMPIDEILLNFDTDNSFDYEKAYKKSDENDNGANTESPKKASFNWYAFPYPVLVVLLYLVIGFCFNIWHPTWLIILTIPIYYMTVTMLKKKSWNAFPYPILALLFFFAAGFIFDYWHPTWLIFLTIPVYYMMINVNRAKGFKQKANQFPYPILCVIFYLSIGFDYGLWHPGWMLFLTIPIYYMLVNMVKS